MIRRKKAETINYGTHTMEFCEQGIKRSVVKGAVPLEVSCFPDYDKELAFKLTIYNLEIRKKSPKVMETKKYELKIQSNG